MLPTTPQDVRRVFIGIPVDQQAQKRINVLLTPIKKLALDIHWIPEPNRHMTLAFLGNVPVARVQNLVESFEKAFEQSWRFQFKLTMLSRFPGRMGRIIALVNDPDTALHDVYQFTWTWFKTTGSSWTERSSGHISPWGKSERLTRSMRPLISQQTLAWMSAKSGSTRAT